MKTQIILILPIISFCFAMSAICYAREYIENYLPEGAIARFGKGYIFHFAYSPDGSKLAVASTIGVWLYDTKTYEELKLFTDNTDYFHFVNFSPDGNTLIGVIHDYDSSYTIQIWDVITGDLVSTFKGELHRIFYTIFNPNSKTVALIGRNGNSIHLWNLITEDFKELNGHIPDVQNIVFCPDGKTLASGGKDEVIRLWDVDSGELKHTFAGHALSIDFLKYSYDGKMIVSYGGDNNICAWNVESGELLHIISDVEDGVSDLDLADDGETLATANSNGLIQTWNIIKGRKLDEFKSNTHIEFVQFSSDRGIIAAYDDNGTTLLFSSNGLELRHTLKMIGRESINDLAFSPDGRMVAVSNGFDINFWNVESGDLVNSITDYYEVISEALFIPNSDLLVSIDRGVRIWDLKTSKFIRTLPATESVKCIQLSPDGNTLACGNYDNHVLLYDVNTWLIKYTLKGHINGISSVAFSPNGNTLVSSSWDKTMRLWNVHSGKYISTLKGETSEPEYVDFHPNGQKVVSLDAGKIRFWDINTGILEKTIDTESDDVYSFVFSPDDRKIVSSVEKKILYYDIDSGELLKSIPVDTWTSYLAYSPDEETIACAMYNGVSLYDSETAELKKTFTGHIGTVNSVSFSADGKTLASCSRDSTVILWEIK
ncbi:PD40 domain-containing protein [Candidatus Poribacteria bacterium]|nr:PD40 domain-containing protein [Candidatus Poribacteria bacterium]